MPNDDAEPPPPEPRERLVFHVTSFSCTVSSFAEFAAGLTQFGVSPRDKVELEDLGDGSFKFSVLLPEKKQRATRVPGQPKPLVIKPEVANQIQARKAAVKAGEEVPGYVPPVPKKIYVKVKKSWTS